MSKGMLIISLFYLENQSCIPEPPVSNQADSPERVKRNKGAEKLRYVMSAMKGTEKKKEVKVVFKVAALKHITVCVCCSTPQASI